MKAPSGVKPTSRMPPHECTRRRFLPCIPCALLSIMLGAEACHLVAWSAVTKYPEAVLRAIAGRQPFIAAQTGSPFDFPLNPIRDARSGFVYGVAVRLRIDGLGERLFLVDTAARGLLLKDDLAGMADLVRVPEWAGSGPGIQTGRFRIFERLWRESFSLSPVVAEVFPGRGFAHVDGILSTEILEPWLVQLDLAKKRMILQPHAGQKSTNTLREWPAHLDRNWWVVTARIADRPIRLLLDTGASHTQVTDEWIRVNLPKNAEGKRYRNSGAGKTIDAGHHKIELDPVHSFSISLSIVPACQIPALPEPGIAGLVGYDVLRHLAFELDYPSGKIHFLR